MLVVLLGNARATRILFRFVDLWIIFVSAMPKKVYV